MPLLNWSDDLTVQSTQMDDQHKGLIAIMNELYDAAHANAGKQRISQIFDSLTQAVVSHFAEEEQHMESMAYPGLETHRRIHVDLVNKYTKYLEEYKQGSGAVNNEIFMFLKMWLAAHINGVDKKYGEYYHQKSA